MTAKSAKLGASMTRRTHIVARYQLSSSKPLGLAVGCLTGRLPTIFNVDRPSNFGLKLVAAAAESKPASETSLACELCWSVRLSGDSVERLKSLPAVLSGAAGTSTAL